MPKISAILILLIFQLIIGVFVLGDYGDSWDEFQFYKYAKLTLYAGNWFTKGEMPTYGNTYDNYGPVYIAGITIITQIVEKTGLNWSLSHVRHMVYFATFLLGVYVFYQLCLRWMGEWAAFGATLLFSTQPLFWGHAFISPKDIPVLSFFLLSFYLGLRMADRVFGKTNEESGSFDRVTKSWDELSKPSRRNLWIATTLGLIFLGFLVFGTQPIHNFISNIIYGIYAAENTSFLSRLFEIIAEDAFSAAAEIYIGKAFLFFQQARYIILLISPLLILGYYRKVFGRDFWRMIAPVIMAGIALGLATSIRILAPLAAILISIHLIRKSGKKAFPILAIYGFVAFYILYLTWPYLWPDPFGRLVESLRVMSQYPWQGQVFFNGAYYPSTGLPWVYLPVVLMIQFTEPVWVLFFVGLTASLWMWLNKKKAVEILWISIVWLLLPIIGLVATGVPLYDNSRQIFFLLPPIFLMAGITLDLFFKKLTHPIVKTVAIIGIILPGIIQGIRLHPYQYIYYNTLVGGVEGASRRFELDYWGLSYLEAAEYLNEVAPPNANIWAAGPSHLLPIREDMSIYSLDQEFRADYYDYVVAMTRYGLNRTTFPEAEILHTISREGAILTVIKGSTQP